MRATGFLAFGFAAVCTLLLIGCPKSNPTTTADAAADATSAGDGGTASTSGGDGGGDDVDSVYPSDPNLPPVPLALKLCTALSEMPEKKRATCCSATPGVIVTSECVRMLSAAMRDKAVEVTEASVDQCISAFDKTLDGCDWVGPFAPGPPKECQSIFKGTLGEGRKCRSSLECTGTLRCKGVGPTTKGKCGPPKENGELCGGTTDSLASFVRANLTLDQTHPECSTGKCIKHRCGPAVLEDAECQVTADCTEGLQCIGAPGAKSKRCVKKALPNEGEACPGGVCSGDLQCISNKCASRKPAGAECKDDFECKGGCLKGDAGTKGKCGMRCDIR
jgi:hypothetical protein